MTSSSGRKIEPRVRTPYDGLGAERFWRTAVARRDLQAFGRLYEPKFSITRNTAIATAGSCFAQNLRHQLEISGCNIVDTEPAPPGLDPSVARRFGFGQFSARYGNIYSTRHLRELIEEAYSTDRVNFPIWEREGRFFDAIRPSIEPEGHATPAAVMRHREQHLDRVRRMIESAELFVFTLGLTEGWIDCATKRIVPSAPGVVAGEYDPAQYQFVNFVARDVVDDLTAVRALLRGQNPSIRMLLTVSPVPLAATASRHHALVANTYSKAVLRAAAGELAAEYADVDYFPSYEIVTGSLLTGTSSFEENMRTVSSAGIAAVMAAFLGSLEGGQADSAIVLPARSAELPSPSAEEDAACEDALLNAFAP